MTAPRIVAERTIAQAERLLAMPVAESPVVVGARLADGDGRGRERVADAVRDVVNPALARYVAALRGPYLAATREEPGSGRPRTARRATGWPSGRGRASTWTRPRSTRSASRAGGDRRRASDDRPGAGFATVADYRARLAADPSNRATTKEALVARAREDIERAAALAPRWFGGCRSPPATSRPVDPFMERDAPPPSTTRRRWTAPPRDLLRQHP